VFELPDSQSCSPQSAHPHAVLREQMLNSNFQLHGNNAGMGSFLVPASSNANPWKIQEVKRRANGGASICTVSFVWP